MTTLRMSRWSCLNCHTNDYDFEMANRDGYGHSDRDDAQKSSSLRMINDKILKLPFAMRRCSHSLIGGGDSVQMATIEGAYSNEGFREDSVQLAALQSYGLLYVPSMGGGSCYNYHPIEYDDQIAFHNG